MHLYNKETKLHTTTKHFQLTAHISNKATSQYLSRQHIPT